MKRKFVILLICILFLGVVFISLLFLKNSAKETIPVPQTRNQTDEMAGFQNSSSEAEVIADYSISIFSSNLPGARDLELSPGGTLLVSLTSAGKIIALPDGNGDGRADKRTEVLSGLRRPHGLAFHKGDLFVAEENKVNRYFWNEDILKATYKKTLFSLPAGGNHFTRSIIFDKEGKLLVSIGSTCNVCEEENPFRAAIIVSDENGRAPRPFAKGLRNSVFMSMNPWTFEIWATEMGRDFLGDNLPPEEINIIKEGGDYGWPHCYGNKVHDDSFDPNNRHSCQSTIPPLHEFQAHSAPLGLVFIDSPLFPKDWQGDLLVAYHGSWNRSVPTGYKIVRMKVDNSKIVSDEDFTGSFVQGSKVIGRPVDLLMNQTSLYVSDDKQGIVYIVRKISR